MAKTGSDGLQWRATIHAPRDGTYILVPLKDFSGADVLFWNEAADESPAGWYIAGSGELCTTDQELDEPGWIPIPSAGWPYGR